MVIAIVAVLVGLGIANVVMRARWHEVEDGVLWGARSEGVTAVEVAPDSPAADVGHAAGRRAAGGQRRPDRVAGRCRRVPAPRHRRARGSRTRCCGSAAARHCRCRSREAARPASMYFVLAAVGLFTLLVGASVRLRRPRDQATLHFFWLCVAFFGAFTFSFNGPFDRLDWVFYWGDAVSMALLPPLLLHFTLVFPERPLGAGAAAAPCRSARRSCTLPALVLGAGRIIAIAARASNGELLSRALDMLDRLEPVYLFVCARRRRSSSWRAAFGEITSLTGRRQLRWIAWGTVLGVGPFALGYALPWAFGVESAACAAAHGDPARPRPARVCVGDRPLSAARRRSHHQARSCLHGVPGGQRDCCISRCGRLVGFFFANDADPHNWIVALLATIGRRAAGAAGEGGRAERARSRVLSRPLRLPARAGRLRARPEQRSRCRSAQPAAGRAHRRNAGRRSHGADAGRRAARRLPGDRRLRVSRSRCPASRGHRRFCRGSIRATPSRSTIRLPQRGSPPRKSSSGAITASTTSCPCVFEGAAIAVLALGRKETDEPFNSEDLALLTAVAGQVATAIENGRLYRQLHLKAEELGRMREFNENILESLDDGLVVFDEDERIVRWNHALEAFYGVTRADAVGRPLSDVFDAAVRRGASRGARREPARRRRCSRCR